MVKIKHLTTLLLLVMLVFPSLFLSSCGGDETIQPQEVTNVTLNKNTLSLVIGTNRILVATVEPDGASNKKVEWDIDDNTVASVDQNGLVTGLSAGSALITVTTEDGAKTATCQLYVTEEVVPVTRVVLNEERIEMLDNQSATLIATIAPVDATNQEVVWSSSDESVALVDQQGKVSGVNEGNAVITVTTEDGGHTAQCDVEIISSAIRVESITVNPSKIGLNMGDAATLAYAILPEDATNKNVAWSSANQGIATVDGNGVITAVSLGITTITVTTADGGKTAECEVTVTNTKVYVCGHSGSFYNTQAYVWLNGVPTKLSAEGVSYSKAKSLCLSGDDVYIAGENDGYPVYWKNGVVNVIDEDAYNSYVEDIYVSGSDIYIAWSKGMIIKQASLWHNGVTTTLGTGAYSAAKGVFASGSDVYVAGEDLVIKTPNEFTLATLWKNGGMEYRLTDGGDGEYGQNSFATAVYVAGSDVYVGGTETSKAWAVNQAKIWKNGQELYHFPVEDDRSLSLVTRIFVAGSDVYAVGEVSDGGASGIVWKNGEELYRMPPDSSVKGLYVIDGDVYATGYDIVNWNSVAKVWKNGEELYTLNTDDPLAATTGLSIVVK